MYITIIVLRKCKHSPTNTVLRGRAPLAALRPPLIPSKKRSSASWIATKLNLASRVNQRSLVQTYARLSKRQRHHLHNARHLLVSVGAQTHLAEPQHNLPNQHWPCRGNSKREWHLLRHQHASAWLSSCPTSCRPHLTANRIVKSSLWRFYLSFCRSRESLTSKVKLPLKR